MAENLMRLLERLVREKRALEAKERRHAVREQRMIESLREMLPGMGYRLVAAEGGSSRASASAPRALKPKRLRCPKCERRFAHPLPMARHLKATHGVSVAPKGRKLPMRTTAKLRKSA